MLAQPLEDLGGADPAVLVVDGRDAAAVSELHACSRDFEPFVLGDGREPLAEAPRGFLAQHSGRLAATFGPFARGRDNVIATGEAAAARYRDGEILGFETVASHVSDDLACVVEVERFRAKVGDVDALAPVALRVTSVFRREDGAWRLVHRHADPITTPQPADSVIQR